MVATVLAGGDVCLCAGDEELRIRTTSTRGLTGFRGRDGRGGKDDC